MQTTPNPFPIPMFRVDTQANLKDKKLGDDDRKYIVRVLATVLCTYVQRPSMRDCEIVAKSLVAKYSFLKEHVSSMLHKYCSFCCTYLPHTVCNLLSSFPVTVIVATRGSTHGCRMGY